ncbi:MAG: succinyl-diaminopimelate desuccinylase [Planktotalea arctica]|uniref:succinyl-diaminopimelate desuccinylase n=1 Tax=Planktotalea arctica TaxID=1481893 RepID=UPI00321919BC
MTPQLATAIDTNTDPVSLTADLVRCQSVTPTEGGALQLLESLLSTHGFDCTRVDRNGISNLCAVWGGGNNGRTFGYNGHTDVVPIGNPEDWTCDPFGAEIRNGVLYGRGATDMKSSVAAFATAAIDFVEASPPDGRLILAITGAEETASPDGTPAILDWMAAQGLKADHFLVGEPTSLKTIGDAIKIGRRGAVTVYLTVTGVQGHSGYPEKAVNPLPALVELLHVFEADTLDEGTDNFAPSTIVITTVDTGNPAHNIIPAECKATVNIRFNDTWTSREILDWVAARANHIAEDFGVTISSTHRLSGECFFTPPGGFSTLIQNAVRQETGMTPALTTLGGISDARHLVNHCPVVEAGLTGESLHKVDEHVAVDEIHTLKAIYIRILHDYFNRPSL